MDKLKDCREIGAMRAIGWWPILLPMFQTVKKNLVGIAVDFDSFTGNEELTPYF